MSDLLRVGLTGNIASGKSTVVGVWRELGAHIIDADVLARQAIEPGSAGYQAVLQEFGTVDRAALRDVVFRDPSRRAALEAIIHPQVERLRKQAEAELQQAGARVIVNDIPLLFEAGLQDRMDIIVLVDAPRALRIERIIEHRGIDRAEAERMVAAQIPAEVKRGRATYVIDNAGTLEQLEARAGEVWREITAHASA